MSQSTSYPMATYNLQGSSNNQTQPFDFMGLAPEIKIMIFEYVLATFDNKALQSPEERTDGWPMVHDTAILCVNRSISEQALPVLYTVNRFHHSVRRGVGTVDLFVDAPLFLIHLHKMRSVSLDFTYQYYVRSDQIQDDEDAREPVPRYLEELGKQCTALRHLSVQFILPSDVIYRHSSTDLGEDDLPCKDAITAALLELKPRLKSLTVLEYGEVDLMEEFCLNLAPKEEWVSGTSRSWGEEELRVNSDDAAGHWGRGEVWVHRWGSGEGMDEDIEML